MTLQLRRALATVVLAGLVHCGGDNGTSPQVVTVTVTTNPQSILPGQSVVATIEVIPEANQTVDYVKIATTGVLTSSESLDVHLAGTFTATRSFTAPQAAGTGTLRVRATAAAGGGLGNGEAVVAVADTTRPVITALSVAPADTAQLGDSVVISYSAGDNAGLRYSILRITGAVTIKDSIDEHFAFSVGHTRRLRIAPTSAPGTLSVTLEVADIGGNIVTTAATPIRVVDTRPPLALGTLVNTRSGAGNGFAPDDTFRLTITGRDNARLQRLGYRFGAPASIADSFSTTDSVLTQTITRGIPASWIGSSTYSVFAVDAVGNRREVLLGSLTVANRTRQPPWSAALDGTVRDMAFDAKRNVLYLSIPDSDRVAVLSLASKSFSAPLAFSGRPRGLDLSLGGDSLLVALRATPYLSVLNLVTSQRDTVRVNNDNFLNRGPDNVRVMANNKALVTITFDGSGYGGSLMELDLGSRALANRKTVTEFVPLCRSGNRSIGLILIDDSCCPIEGVVYDALNGAFPADRGTVSRFFNYVSSDYSGARLLITHELFTTGLTSLGSFAPAGATGPSVLAPDGATAYFATSTGITNVRISDGAVIGSVNLGAQPSQLAIASDGLTLFAAVPGAVHVIDEW
ncbi:MAG TPA: hypothetical protein VGU74_11750 [Gemmatimonadales bacterium]|nr:hypothetical protein [Gemmatimonadales bacterium]